MQSWLLLLLLLHAAAVARMIISVRDTVSGLDSGQWGQLRNEEQQRCHICPSALLLPSQHLTRTSSHAIVPPQRNGPHFHLSSLSTRTYTITTAPPPHSYSTTRHHSLATPAYP